MRITSPKNVRITNDDYGGFNKPYFSNNSQAQLGLKSRESFYSRKQSEHSSKLAQDNTTGQKYSGVTQSLQSGRSTKSRSKYQGISMSRDRAIRMENIYQAEHFPVMKNQENKSAKSITLSTNRNTKSISRVTRTTSPTVTQYPLKGFNENSTWANTSINGSVRQIPTNKSIQKDVFDFNDLRKEINKSTQQKSVNPSQNILLSQQNEDYYGLNSRFNNKKFQPILNNPKTNKIPNNFQVNKNIIQNSFDNQYVTCFNSNKNSNSSSKKQPLNLLGKNQISPYKNQPPNQSGLISPRTKSPSQLFGISPKSNKSSKMITIEKDLTLNKMSLNIQKDRKLGWKDVVKK